MLPYFLLANRTQLVIDPGQSLCDVHYIGRPALKVLIGSQDEFDELVYKANNEGGKRVRDILVLRDELGERPDRYVAMVLGVQQELGERAGQVVGDSFPIGQ